MDENSPQPIAAAWMIAIREGNHARAWSLMTERYRRERVEIVLGSNAHHPVIGNRDPGELADRLTSLDMDDPFWEEFALIDAANWWPPRKSRPARFLFLGAKMARSTPLKAAGKALHKKILSGLPDGWELDEREASVLELAARQADVVADLEAVVKKEGVMAVGSTGQPTIHPAVMEARLGRLAIDRLIGKIVLPSPEKHEGETAATIRARNGGYARLTVARTREERRRGAA